MGGVLLHELANDLVQVMGNFRHQALGRIELGIAMLVQQLRDSFALERRPAGEQRVQDHTEGIEVAALGDRLAGGLLG